MRTLQQLERDYILTILKECNGNMTRTAMTLGIGRRTLYTKLKQYESSDVFFRDALIEIRSKLKSLVEKKTE